VSETLEQTSNTSTTNEPLPQYLQECLDLIRPPNIVGEGEVLTRCIYLDDGKVFFGIPMVESDDSFLVGAAVRLVMNPAGRIEYDPLVPTGVLRLFKSGLKFVTAAVPKYQNYYFLYLRDKGFKLLPTYFTEERKQTVLDFIQAYEFMEGPPVVVSDTPTNLAKSMFESQGIQGLSDDAFVSLHHSKAIH
jgi:hypothetical protein